MGKCISVVVCLPPKKRIVLPLWYHLRVLRSSCSTMLISMPIGHWGRSYSASCRYQSDTVFYHSAHHLRFMAFVLVYEPYFPAASIRVHRQSSFRIFHKGDRFPKAAVRTLVRNRSRFSGGSNCGIGTRSFFQLSPWSFRSQRPGEPRKLAGYFFCYHWTHLFQKIWLSPSVQKSFCRVSPGPVR